MTVAEMAKELSLKPLVVADGTREVTGGYAGDLLSWVMGRATSGDAWVTIMSNANIVAVATLADPSAVILSEGVVPEENVIKLAETKGVNLYMSEEDTFSVCGKLSKLL